MYGGVVLFLETGFLRVVRGGLNFRVLPASVSFPSAGVKGVHQNHMASIRGSYIHTWDNRPSMDRAELKCTSFSA